jgi:hypothetical protein
MKKYFLFAIIFLLILALPKILAAHYIVGIVSDAKDGTPANGRTITLWNPSFGLNDNLTDIIGPAGNSGADNIYMIDCELLNNSCKVEDELRAQIFDSGDDYLPASYTNLTVTGAGFDIMPNLTLNSPPYFFNLSIDDSFTLQPNEIDLTPASTSRVACEGIVIDYDGDSTVQNLTAKFFDNSASAYGNNDSNNEHYTNNSCYLDTSYGEDYESHFTCSFDVQYYANSGVWNCTLNMTDNISVPVVESNTTTINSLLALSIVSPVDFGEIAANQVSLEAIINVSNAGNKQFNLTLSGYGAVFNDGLAMNCSNENISVSHMKYNLTNSNPGTLNFAEFSENYLNLTSSPETRLFNLDFRKNDTADYAFNSTYWRIYAPSGIVGNCSGNIIFGAVQATSLP